MTTGRAWSAALNSTQFYDRIIELAGLKRRSEAKGIAVAVMRELLGRLSRQSAGLIAESLPSPMPRLFTSELPVGSRFASFKTLAVLVADELRVSPDTAIDYLRAVGTALEEKLDPLALECLRAEIPAVAREILPAYIPVSSERPSVLLSSTPEPLCTAPDDGKGRLSYLHTPV